MNGKEVRMRCIESLSTMGVREPGRLIRDAEQLEDWVNAAEDKEVPPKRAAKTKTADK